jgi:hypothetical protein
MTSRNLARRLERLEEEILPGEERVIILHITRHTGSRGSPGTWLARHVVGGNHSGGAESSKNASWTMSSASEDDRNILRANR